MKKKTYLVSGGNGYIGSHMVKALVELGHHVHWIDNCSAGPKKSVHSYGEFHRLDISDKKVLTLLKKIRPHAILHFAAKANVPEGEAHPFFYYKENLGKTIEFLEYTVQARVKRFIFSSTAAVYGVPQGEKLAEDHAKNPINTYGMTKFLMERVMEDLCRKELLNVVALRYFNVVGADPEGILGENHQPETHLVPKMVQAHLQGKNKKFEIYGETYPTRDGTCIRDYVHVMDLVQGHLMALEHLEKANGFHAFNLGSETGHTVKEVVSAFERATAKKMKVNIAAAREGDVPVLVADSQKAQKNWGFSCHYSLENAILHTLEFSKKRKKSGR